MKIRGWLLDVEGVLVADKRFQAVPGAPDFIRRLRAANCPLRLITNNTTDNRSTLVRKLADAGFDFALNELHTCIAAAVNRLRQIGARRCLVLGNAALRGMFAEAGLQVVDDADVAAVVVGLDMGVTYERLALACQAVVRHDAALIALHRNRLFTDGAGRTVPSVGAIVAAIEYATRAEPTVIGKPSPVYFRQALAELNTPPADVMVVSDDPLTDLVGAKKLGMRTAFVLSGKYHDSAILEAVEADLRPDITTARIGDLLAANHVTL